MQLAAKPYSKIADVNHFLHFAIAFRLGLAHLQRDLGCILNLREPVAGEAVTQGVLLPADTGLTIITYTVEPATPSAEALQFLNNWATSVVPSAHDAS